LECTRNKYKVVGIKSNQNRWTDLWGEATRNSTRGGPRNGRYTPSIKKWYRGERLRRCVRGGLYVVPKTGLSKKGEKERWAFGDRSKRLKTKHWVWLTDTKQGQGRRVRVCCVGGGVRAQRREP